MSESEVKGKITREPFELPEEAGHLSPDEIIADISERQPHINNDGTVDFLIKAKGQLNNVIITERLWAVTLANLGESNNNLGELDLDSAKTWGGML